MIQTLFLENGKAVLHGISSWNMGCGTTDSFGGVSANVFNLMFFVNDVLVRTLFSLTMQVKKLILFLR